MQDEISFPEKREYAVTVENLHFKLLIDKISIGREIKIFDNTMHTHSHVEVFVCIKGRILLNTAEGIIKVFANDIAIVPKDCLHNRVIEANDNENEWCEINIAVSKKQLRSETDLFSPVDRLLNTSGIRVIKNRKNIAGEIYDIFLDASGINPSFPEIRAVSVITRLAKEFSDSSRDINNSDFPRCSDIDFGLLYKLNHIINTCFMKDYSNTQIAEMLFISERQLSRITSKHYGMTIRNAITEKRIISSGILLINTDDSIDAICTAVGFKSKSTFYREFRKKYGITPAEYRKQKSKNNSDEPM